MLQFTLGRDQFAVLCDGLGGYPDGDWASATFVQAVHDAITRQIPADDTLPEQAMRDWLQQAWHLFRERQQQEQRSDLAQTTCAVLWLAEEFTLTAHAGDSRVYLLDAQHTLWRTKDHNLYELGILNGDIDPLITPQPQGQQALLYRSVSGQKAFKPAIAIRPALISGQLAILCSDGAWNYVSDTEWQGLAGNPDCATQLAALLQLAVQRGGEKADNASALALIKI